MAGFHRWHAWLLVVVLLQVIRPAFTRASSQDLFGLGARGLAMGGALVSNVSGYASVYYNPAALGRLGQRQFVLGYQRADYDLTLNDAAFEVTAASNLLIGLSTPIPLGGAMQNRLALGFGFLLPTTSVLLADIPAPEEPYFAVVGNRHRTVGLHVGLALRLADWLHLGGGVVALAELVGGLKVAPNELGLLGSEVRDELVADYSAIVGLLVIPLDWLSLGVSFHDASAARFTFPIETDLGPEFPIEVPLLDVSGTAQYDPLQVSADVTVQPFAGLALAVGFSFKRWSAFGNPLVNTTTALPPQDPPDFSDIWVPRLGAEYIRGLGPVTAAFRIGGFFEPTPVPEQVANHNYLDSDRWALGLGTGLLWRGLKADLGFQLQWMPDRMHVKDVEQIRDPENPGLPRIAHRGSIAVFTLEVGVAF
ncbi:MAG: hypothetical protein JW797_03925 [Bradymonadales bacterium]|nr:hypothetical protein [Bradymonadales bacterium]